ncbi:ABC transporter permease subunit [Actinomadura sp. 6N118]|uniref:ABC transporter permease subunit n=1 Tax=Actinomadura sp. 6N118 TaxID=3375151 RepID=UPI00379D5FEB
MSTALAHVRQADDLRVTTPRVVHMEWIKFRSLRSTMYTLAVAVVLLVGFGVLLTSLQGTGTGPDEGGDLAATDPTSLSLSGTMLAALAIAVLGVLMTAGEYATGTIRATFSAVPARLPVLWGKAVAFAAAAFLPMLAATLVAFLAGQAILSARGFPSAALSDPGVLRAVAGAAVYLTGAGLIGLAVGALLRNTAASITTVVGALFVVPGLIQLLPDSWSGNISPYLPSNAAGSFMAVRPSSDSLSTWPGLAVFAAYIAILLAGAAVALKRRDA